MICSRLLVRFTLDSETASYWNKSLRFHKQTFGTRDESQVFVEIRVCVPVVCLLCLWSKTITNVQKKKHQKREISVLLCDIFALVWTILLLVPDQNDKACVETIILVFRSIL